MKVTIITPTIGRTTLLRTCESINHQDYPEIQHIVMVDNPDLKESPLIKLIDAYNRDIYFCEHKHENMGNTCRHNAFKYIEGQLVVYLDDDDYYTRNNAISDIVRGFLQAKKPDWGIFPVTRLGKQFFNIPAGRGRTCSNQFFHKTWISGRPIKWFDNNEYEADGMLIDFLKEHYPNYGLLCSVKSVANIDKVSKGK